MDPDYEDGRSAAVDPTPDGFDELRQAMESTPPSSIAQGQTHHRGGGGVFVAVSNIISFLGDLRPLKSTLQRPFTECRESVILKLNSLGVQWSEPHGTGNMSCEHGQQGTADYVSFGIRWTTNGASSPAIWGASMWYTKITVEKRAGSGPLFHELGKEVLDAVRYEVREGVQHDYLVNTWGLY
jgi:hypothetical protein